jgi:uncharacterized membrane protein YdjX (TVP38/TMEM64 family)
MSDVNCSPEVRPPTRPLWLRLGVLAAFIVGLAVFLNSDWAGDLSWQGLREHYADLRGLVVANTLAAGAAFMLIYVVATAFSVPGAVWLTIAGGLLFGPKTATAMVVVSATVGACAIFTMARYALGDVLRARAGSAIARMEAGFRRDALNYMLVLRLVPLFPFFLVNLVPAFLGVSLRTFALGTFIGIIPGTFVFATLGAGLGDAIETDIAADPGAALLQVNVIVALAGLAILALVPVIYRRRQARRG